MRKNVFSVNWLTSRFRFIRNFYYTINRDLNSDFRTRDSLTSFFTSLGCLKPLFFALGPTWLESPGIQGFRTGPKLSVAQWEHIENRDFLNLVMGRNLGENKK
jgi:hypothetical protein